MTLTDAEFIAIVSARQTIAGYVHTVDARDGNAVAALFTPDGVIEGHIGPFHGRDEIRTFFTDLPQTSPPRRHHVHSVNVRFDGDGVLRGTSYLQVIGGKFVAGVYDHEFELVGGDWLIKHKRITIEIR